MAYYFYELVEKLVDDFVYMSSYRCAKLNYKSCQNYS